MKKSNNNNNPNNPENEYDQSKGKKKRKNVNNNNNSGSSEGANIRSDSKSNSRLNVCVVVLGDIGRSPRMQYHSLSLASLPNANVSLVGLKGKEPHPLVRENPNINIHHIPTFPALPRILFPIYAPIKVLFQALFLLFTILFVIPSPDYILVQTPPAIPTLAVVYWASLLKRAKLVIDWHNLGYTLLLMSTNKKERNPVIKFVISIAKWIEGYYGRKAYWNFTVTEAEIAVLNREFGIDPDFVSCLYDRPDQKIFKPLSEEEKIDFLAELVPKLPSKDIPHFASLTDFYHTKKGPALVTSSTSWTPDEDFQILLDAIVLCESYSKKNKGFPKIIFVITGTGPLKEYYENKIASLDLKNMFVTTMWLEAKDYPKILACADVGVSLHASSSGVDLPMKVVDMMGCALPALALHFNCLHELVQDRENGRVFKTSDQLANLLVELFSDWPKLTEVKRMRKVIESRRERNEYSWEANWNQVAAPVFSK
eukprot:TRINITY_DN6156_c0_g1_i1.p1 TRINITY_DN6156_c0_g1~~TRINITY_DN6156_c0_g1_i1.p1  ORF type:complete len:499 (+),score=106.81 TRINITY_DN6156_c0_g1_i1:50-1498(+)